MSNTPVPDNVREALVAQFNTERYNAACYKSVQSAFEAVNWHGFAAWCGKSSQEETDHSNRFFKYLADRQAEIAVEAIPQPPEFFGEDLLDNFDAILKLEVDTTAKIQSLARLALDMNDFLTLEFLQWFLKEQYDSEAKVVQIIADLEHGQCDAARIAIDRELGGA